MNSRTLIGSIAACVVALGAAGPASAFCGLYVAKAGTEMFNQASKVVITRHGSRTVITMANDYQGNPKEFAIVVPVPQVPTRKQIRVIKPQTIAHLDAYTAPRLVEYFDRDPCEPRVIPMPAPRAAKNGGRRISASSLGVKIEARYAVGEYDIIILSAKQSTGLQTWLKQQGYKVPAKARPVLNSYLAAGMKFFVARVNLKRRSKLGFSFLRPLQIDMKSPKFMLPIRLGMVNAKGPQELFVFVISRRGRVVTTNYRTVQMPSNFEIPLYVKNKKEFAAFYKTMFSHTTAREGRGVVLMEYAWNMAWCDPCAAKPLSRGELRELGVFWLGEAGAPPHKGSRPGMRRRPRPVQAYVTRLHFRYDATTHPEDLMFEETANTGNFQGRYILRHPYKGKAQCDQAKKYFRTLPKRYEKEAANLARSTGWDINEIRRKMEKSGQSFRPGGARE